MSAGKKKSVRMLVKLVSLARTGFFYVSDHATLFLLVTSFSLSDYASCHFLLQVAEKNPRNVPWKLKLMKYDPVVNKHVLFEEQKLK
jgi:large subunit ribosomal protein L33